MRRGGPRPLAVGERPERPAEEDAPRRRSARRCRRRGGAAWTCPSRSGPVIATAVRPAAPPRRRAGARSTPPPAVRYSRVTSRKRQHGGRHGRPFHAAPGARVQAVAGRPAAGHPAAAIRPPGGQRVHGGAVEPGREAHGRVFSSERTSSTDPWPSSARSIGRSASRSRASSSGPISVGPAAEDAVREGPHHGARRVRTEPRRERRRDVVPRRSAPRHGRTLVAPSVEGNGCVCDERVNSGSPRRETWTGA